MVRLHACKQHAEMYDGSDYIVMYQVHVFHWAVHVTTSHAHVVVDCCAAGYPW